MTQRNQLPSIPLNLREKKLPIAINFSVLVLTSCAFPILLYFVLKYPAKAADTIYLSIGTIPFGVSSVFTFIKRLYRLTKKDSIYLPIGGTRSQVDFFQWDFLFGFVLITAAIVLSVAIPNKTVPRLAAMPLSIFLFDVCLQIVLVNILTLFRVCNPIRISSIPKGAVTRPALYSIIEDIVAVDGGQGRQFREAFDARYRASSGGEMERLLVQMGWFWGVGGLVTAGLTTGLVFGVPNHDAVYVIGWTIPWAWAALSTLVAFSSVKKSLRREAAAARRVGA